MNLALLSRCRQTALQTQSHLLSQQVLLALTELHIRIGRLDHETDPHTGVLNAAKAIVAMQVIVIGVLDLVTPKTRSPRYCWMIHMTSDLCSNLRRNLSILVIWQPITTIMIDMMMKEMLATLAIPTEPLTRGTINKRGKLNRRNSICQV